MNTGKVFTLGTAVRITTVLSMNNPTSVKIIIKDPSGIVKVNEVSMTGDTASVFSYIHQSLETDSEGEYEITIKANYGAYTAVSKEIFSLEK
jgi:hypothetical protein